MTKMPGMMLWTDKYLADTTHLTTCEHGAYLLILMAMWRAGGYLPDDEALLCRITKLPPGKWRKMEPIIRAFFMVVVDGENGGKLTQKRLQAEILASSKRVFQLHTRGHSGGVAKALKYKERRLLEAELSRAQACQTAANKKEKDKDSETASLNETRASTPTPECAAEERPLERQPEPVATPTPEPGPAKAARKHAKDSTAFARFWEAWPNKVGKPYAEKCFAKHVGEIDAILAGIERYKTDKPPDRQWLNPSTFLNQQRWNDQPAATVAHNGNGGNGNGRGSVQDVARRFEDLARNGEITIIERPPSIVQLLYGKSDG